MLSLYTPSKIAVKGMNVDQKEGLHVLVSYTKCLLDRYKECAETSKAVKNELKNNLYAKLCERFINVSEVVNVVPSADLRTDRLIYDVVGYLLHSRRKCFEKCPDCTKSLLTKLEELPNDFREADFTEMRSHGGLKYPSVRAFQVFKLIEEVICDHFKKPSHVYLTDTFHAVMDKIGGLSLQPLCCSIHQSQVSPTSLWSSPK